MGSNFDKFLKEYGGDNHISGTDIKNAAKAGYSADQLNRYTKKANKQDYTSGTGTQTQLNKIGSSSGSSESSNNTPPGATSTDFNIDNAKDLIAYQYTFDSNLLDKSLSSNETISALQTEAQKAVAASYAGATKYGWDTQYDIAGINNASEERWRNYGKLQDRLSAENVATIQGGYSLDLQDIVNEGAKDVAKIQGEYGVQGIKLQGAYGLESDRIKGATARDVASRQKDAQIFGSLMSGFW